MVKTSRFVHFIFNTKFIPQLDVDGHIDSVIILLSPRQVHLLLDLVGAFSGGGGEIRSVRYLFLASIPSS